MEVMKVSSKTQVGKLAGVIANVIREEGSAELQAIGAGCVNQIVKSVAVARGFLASSGIDLICIPSFTSVKGDNGSEKTAIKFIVEPRR